MRKIVDMTSFPTSEYQRDETATGYGLAVRMLAVAPSSYTPPDGESFDDTSVTSAWRGATLHAHNGIFFSNDANATTIQRAFQGAHDMAQILRDLAPDSGAYLNEADLFEPDPAGAYWGEENFARLTKLKKELDPDNILTCWHCIGWSREDDRYGCWPSL